MLGCWTSDHASSKEARAPAQSSARSCATPRRKALRDRSREFVTDDAERNKYEKETFWFYDGLHYPEPLYPFDTIWDEAWFLALSQFNNRIFQVPPVPARRLYASAASKGDTAVATSVRSSRR